MGDLKGEFLLLRLPETSVAPSTTGRRVDTGAAWRLSLPPDPKGKGTTAGGGRIRPGVVATSFIDRAGEGFDGRGEPTLVHKPLPEGIRERGIDDDVPGDPDRPAPSSRSLPGGASRNGRFLEGVVRKDMGRSTGVEDDGTRPGGAMARPIRSVETRVVVLGVKGGGDTRRVVERVRGAAYASGGASKAGRLDPPGLKRARHGLLREYKEVVEEGEVDGAKDGGRATDRRGMLEGGGC